MGEHFLKLVRMKWHNHIQQGFIIITSMANVSLVSILDCCLILSISGLSLLIYG